MIDLLIGQLILHLFVDHISREIDKKEADKKPLPVTIVPSSAATTKVLGAGVS